jgi:uncharacterized protein (DUF488 family)
MEGEDFRATVERVRAMAQEQRIALLCAEREPVHCHRSFISDYLCAFGDDVVHLVRPVSASSTPCGLRRASRATD